MKIKGEPIIGNGVMTVELKDEYGESHRHYRHTDDNSIFRCLDKSINAVDIDDIQYREYCDSKYLNLYDNGKLTATLVNGGEEIETEALLSDRIFLEDVFEDAYNCTAEAYMAERGIEIKQTEKERIRETFTNSTFSDEERDDIEKYFTLKKAGVDKYIDFDDICESSQRLIQCEFSYEEQTLCGEWDNPDEFIAEIMGIYYPEYEGDHSYDDFDITSTNCWDTSDFYKNIREWLNAEFCEMVGDIYKKREKYNRMVAVDKETGEESFINLYEKDGKIFDMRDMLRKFNKEMRGFGGCISDCVSAGEGTFCVDEKYAFEVTSYAQNLHRYAVLEQGKGTNKGDGEIER